MSILWTSALRDTVALTVLGCTYAELRAAEKTALDGNASPPTSAPGGLAKQAVGKIDQYAQWFTDAGLSAGAPAAWEHLLQAETSYRFAQVARPERARDMGRDVAAAWEAALSTYDAQDYSSSAVNPTAWTLALVRQHVVRTLVRMRGRPMAPVALIDSCAKRAFDALWMHADWTFRLRNVTITLRAATPGSPTFAGLQSGESFDHVVSDALVYDDSTGPGVGSVLRFADSAGYTRARAGVTAAGRPRVFTVEHVGSTRVWKLAPAPDVDYAVVGVVAVQAPAWAASISSTDPFAKLPDAHRAVYPSMVVAQVLTDLGHQEAPAQRRHVEDRLADLLTKADSRGTPDRQAAAEVDVYGDVLLGSLPGVVPFRPGVRTI